MKTISRLLYLLFAATLFCACGGDDDDDDSLSELEKKYFSVENGIFKNGSFPAATLAEILSDVDVSNQAMNGAMNYVTIISEEVFQKFFVGVRGISGYWEYIPGSTSGTYGFNAYVIPVMISNDFDSRMEFLISGQKNDGGITKPYSVTINEIETLDGALEVKLAFSNDKDVDLHLFLPDNEHIYYGNRGSYSIVDDDDVVGMGLDVDSNADCMIDGINKENIFVSNELLQEGTYKVVVDMYKNCDPSVATYWSIIVRLNGEIITPISGRNPASGFYDVGAGNGDLTQVMTFKVTNGQITRASMREFDRSSLIQIPMSEMDIWKYEHAFDH